jgi:hypothetical protein
LNTVGTTKALPKRLEWCVPATKEYHPGVVSLTGARFGVTCALGSDSSMPSYTNFTNEGRHLVSFITCPRGWCSYGCNKPRLWVLASMLSQIKQPIRSLRRPLCLIFSDSWLLRFNNIVGNGRVRTMLTTHTTGMLCV